LTGVSDDGGVIWIAPAHVDHLTAHIYSVDQSRGCVVILQITFRLGGPETRPDGKDLHIPCHSGHANPVVSHGANNSGNVGAMKVLVFGVVILAHIVSDSHIKHLGSIGEIPSTPVIDITVAVVIDAIIRDLMRIDIDIGSQVRVIYQHPGIHHSYEDEFAARGEIPGLGSGCNIVKLLWIAGVVWLYMHLAQIVGLNVCYSGEAEIAASEVLPVWCGCEVHQEITVAWHTYNGSQAISSQAIQIAVKTTESCPARPDFQQRLRGLEDQLIGGKIHSVQAQ